jgi:thioredoxin-like negative regulator of GroEL
MYELADELVELQRADEAHDLLVAALQSARRQRRDDGRDESMAIYASRLAELGYPQDAGAVLSEIPDGIEKRDLLCALGVAEAKAGNRERAAERFTAAYALAKTEEFDNEGVLEIVERQADAGFTDEALAAARAMPNDETEDGSTALIAIDSVATAMARQGKLVQAFGTARTLRSAHLFVEFYELLTDKERSAEK